jgi:hypothetical protein
MPLKAHRILIGSLVAALLAGFTACGGDSGSSATNATVTSVVLSPAALNVAINTSANISAQVNLSNTTVNTSTAVTWLVNGVAGGNSTVGTIVPSSTNQQVGVYTAPTAVPATNNGQVNVTATAPQDPSNSTDTTRVTSNTSIVTITAGQGLLVNPTGQTVPAGGSFQFTATLNSLPDPNAKWSISSTTASASQIGKIDPDSGIYTAPLAPPPGQTVTVTATHGAINAMATATVVYSDASLKGPYAFAYSGGIGANFIAVAGSFVADGQGSILSGVEDIENFSTGVSMQVLIQRGSYVVEADGTTNATLNTGGQVQSTLQFALTSDQHGVLIRFDQNTVASGSVDQQNLNALTGSPSVISGPYVFGVAGEDTAQKTMAVAGKFSANAGAIPSANTIFDINDGGTVTTPTSAPVSSVSLSGNYAFDAVFPGTGRGTVSLTLTTSNGNQQFQFAFYTIDSADSIHATHLHLVEIDSKALLAGDVFSSPAGNSFTASSLSQGNFAFTSSGTAIDTVMGNPVTVAFAAGGVFASDGAGNVTGGVLDSNSGGTPGANTTIASCTYAVNAATGRIDLRLFTGAGACPAGANASTTEFALYPTAQGSAVLVEIDPNAMTNGLAFLQAPAPAAPTGSFAILLATLGTSKNLAGVVPQDASGQLTLTGAAVSGGSLDINNSNAVFVGDPIATTSTITAPDATHGRGTITLSATSPPATFSLDYYVLDANRAVFLDQDTTRVGTGLIAKQF